MKIVSFNSVSFQNFYKNINSITKFRLSVMNASMVLMGYSFVNISLLPSSLIFTSSLMTSCALQAIGQVKEQHIDSLMKRTSNRQHIISQLTPSYINYTSVLALLA